jgi:hypothetical protein
MSFDLWSFRCPEGWDPDVFHSQLIGLENSHVGVDHSVTAPDRAKSLAFAECLHRHVDDLYEVSPVEHDEAFALQGELLTVTVSRALAEINVPYRGPCDETQLIHALTQCVACARDVAGLGVREPVGLRRAPAVRVAAPQRTALTRGPVRSLSPCSSVGRAPDF